MKIHVWVPEYASATGGIQTFSRFVVLALRDIYPTADIAVFSKNDTSFPEEGKDGSTTFVPLGWWGPKARTVAFAAEIFRQGVLHRPDLIVTTHVNFSPVAHSLRRLFRIPYLAVGHGIDVWEIKSRPLRAALRTADCLVAVSEFTRSRMSTVLGLPPERIRIIPDTFDPEAFEPSPKPRFLLKRFGLRMDQPVILTIARLASAERYKGYDQVLSAIPAIRRQFPDVRYILGGRGPDRGRVESLIAELDVAENVILAGYVAEHELCEFYNLCDVFAMPSKGEGFGIVFLEAMACGKPVIAGNKDGSVDAVLSGRIGALIDPDDVKEIEATLLQLLQGTHPNPTLRDPGEVRRRVIEAYGYERFVEILRGVLEEMVEQKC